jgi:hypothetical protein
MTQIRLITWCMHHKLSELCLLLAMWGFDGFETDKKIVVMPTTRGDLTNSARLTKQPLPSGQTGFFTVKI